MVFKIKGGKKLKGEIIPQGAKNEALQILSATLLTEEPVTIHNIPNIVDVERFRFRLGRRQARLCLTLRSQD